MSERRDHIRGAILVAVALATARAVAGVPDEPEDDGRALRGRTSGSLRAAFRAASREARRKLRTRHCQEVFASFRDGSGTPLEAILDRRRRTPEDHFAEILFYDGRFRLECGRPRLLAFTSPGSRAVFLCGSFAEQTFRSVGYSADILIHEELHTLGLGENPPTSGEITARVEAACD
jgi:hypothetical protein